jgi:hypothetical protein
MRYAETPPPMHYTDFDPSLAYCVRLAAAWYGMTPSKYVRVMVQRAVDDLADHNPLIREAFDNRP